jgi:hypothetical protein
MHLSLVIAIATAEVSQQVDSCGLTKFDLVFCVQTP